MKVCSPVILVLALVVMSTHCAAATRIISTAELISACEHNKPPCDGTPNTRVAVRGEILTINTRGSGEPYVSLKGRDERVNVQCFFPKADADILVKLHAGETV